VEIERLDHGRTDSYVRKQLREEISELTWVSTNDVFGLAIVAVVRRASGFDSVPKNLIAKALDAAFSHRIRVTS
jgi:hypothetical protein